MSLNVGGGVRLIKSAKLYLCTQKHYKHNADGRTAPGVCGNCSVPLSHSGNVITRIGIHTQVGAGGVIWTFSLEYLLNSLPSFFLWETTRYRLKYCLKGPLNPNNQPTCLGKSCSFGNTVCPSCERLSFCVCASFPFGLKVDVRFDCIISLSSPFFLLFYPPELKLNKANVSYNNAAFLNDTSISNGYVSSRI